MSTEGNQSANNTAETVRDPEVRRAENNRRRKARQLRYKAAKAALAGSPIQEAAVELRYKAAAALADSSIQEATQHSKIEGGKGADDDNAEGIRKPGVRDPEVRRATNNRRRRARRLRAKTFKQALLESTQSLAQESIVRSEVGDGKARISAESAENPSIETKPIFAIKFFGFVVKLEPLADAE